jgi:hypothetical protein
LQHLPYGLLGGLTATHVLARAGMNKKTAILPNSASSELGDGWHRQQNTTRSTLMLIKKRSSGLP